MCVVMVIETPNVCHHGDRGLLMYVVMVIEDF